MNPTPAPEADGPLTSQQRGHDRPEGPLAVESTTVPRQKAGPHGTPRPGANTPAGTVPADRPGPTEQDPLDHPDPLRAADSAGTENLLRCWTRENDLPRPPEGHPAYPAPARAAPPCSSRCVHWSATGWHRFGTPALENAPRTPRRPTPSPWPRCSSRESRAQRRGRPGGQGAPTPYATPRPSSRPGGAAPSASSEADLFLTAEQSLVLGHPLHPTPKSREGLSETETLRYSPELRGSFPLHWMAVDRSVLATRLGVDQGRQAGSGRRQLLAPARRRADASPTGTVALPLHPWQAARGPAPARGRRPVRDGTAARPRTVRRALASHLLRAHRAPPRLRPSC